MHRKKWLLTLGIGLLGNWLITWTFDFILYPTILAIYGLVTGTLLMTVLSFIVCYITILFYDGTKKDWLGIETVKEIKNFVPRGLSNLKLLNFFILTFNHIGEFASWIMKKSDVFFMIALSIKFDPFITVIHIRHGAHQYNGLSKRDWIVFITSLIIGNLYWALAVYLGITIFDYFWKFFLSIPILLAVYNPFFQN